MWKKKTRTCKLFRNDKIICKKFLANLKKKDLHRKGPINCVCFKDLDTIYNNEVNLLQKLKNYDHFPKVLKTCKDTKELYMSYCGTNLRDLVQKKKLKIPKDWDHQIKQISLALNENNIYHNDICHTNVCIYKDKIYLIDFGCCQPLDIKIKENFDNRTNFSDLNNLFKSIKK